MRAASGRKRDNVLGALDAVTHRLIRVTNFDSINAESVWALCARWRKRRWDCRSRWCWTTRAPRSARVQGVAESLGIELLYLPAYSPNLNLIERLWRFVRKESLNSTSYEAFEQFTTAIDQCLDGLPSVHKSEMETLLTHEFQMFGDVLLLAA